MDAMTASYTREAAVAEGRLIDVSYLNYKHCNPFPTYISTALREACRRERPEHSPEGRLEHGASLEERIREVITLLPLFRWLEKGAVGEFTIYFDSSQWLREPLHLRVMVERDTVHRKIVTILLEGERLDFRGPRPLHGGSFFVM